MQHTIHQCTEQKFGPGPLRPEDHKVVIGAQIAVVAVILFIVRPPFILVPHKNGGDRVSFPLVVVATASCAFVTLRLHASRAFRSWKSVFPPN